MVLAMLHTLSGGEPAAGSTEINERRDIDPEYRRQTEKSGNNAKFLFLLSIKADSVEISFRRRHHSSADRVMPHVFSISKSVAKTEYDSFTLNSTFYQNL
jgi:hypothetical protein